MLKTVLIWLLKILSFYVCFLLALFAFQEHFLFHPYTFDQYDQTVIEDIEATVVSYDNLQWLYLPAYREESKLLIYFHGNGGAAVDRVGKAELWRRAGYDVILAEYPGYGTNGQIAISEVNLYAVGRKIINKTLSDFPGHKLYIYGESIGSGMAVQMAAEYKEKALIIESGFSSLSDIVASKLPFIPASLLLKYKFDNQAKINTINSYLLILHGDRDEVIPYKYGQKLYNSYNGDKNMITIKGARHNNIYAVANMAGIIKDIP